MPTQQIQLTFESLNSSVQIGDSVYYTTPNPSSSTSFDSGALVDTYYLGDIVNFIGNTIVVQFDDVISPLGPLAQGCLISFVKDKKINTSSLVGYYAEVNFVNNSTDKAELFSVGSEISESSK